MKKFLYTIIFLNITFQLGAMHGGSSNDCADCGDSGASMSCTIGGGNDGCVPCCSDGNNNIWGGSGASDNGNSQIQCGNIGSIQGADFFYALDGTICTKSEMLEATALYGNWVNAIKRETHGRNDKVLPGAQATIIVVMQILARFNSGHNLYKGQEKYKISCAMEYIEGVCKLENEMHYCHKDYNPHGEPRLHFKSEEQRQEVTNLLKKMKENGNI